MHPSRLLLPLLDLLTYSHRGYYCRRYGHQPTTSAHPPACTWCGTTLEGDR